VLVKLGCSGETTTTMINGGRCTDRYPVGSSQLSAAEAFLAAHGADVKYVTIDIGANDVDGCAPGGSIDAVCLAKGVLTIAQNLDTIMSRLKAAATDVPSRVGMNYYDPFLEYWLNGPQGQVISQASVALLVGVNTVETAIYELYGFKIADVVTAYNTLNVLNFDTVAPYGKLPRNVATICRLTYMCSVQNIHPNVTGYQVIADAFLRKMG
jgi:lysophospholipase L1-like esterase